MSLEPVQPAAGGQLLPASSATLGPVGLKEELALWRDAFEFAQAIAGTPFAPGAYQGNAHAVMACIIKGHELGVSALHSLASIYVIDGRPCVAAELQRALIQSRGHEIHIEEYNSEKATIWGKRKGASVGTKVTFTMVDARKARLEGKPTWQRYPADMLVARATGRVARFEFADVLAGLSYNYEELSDQLVPGSTPMLEAPAPDEAPKPRTRRARAAAPAAAASPAPASAAGSPAEGPQEAHLSPPGGPPPPLPGEEGYVDVGTGAGNATGSGFHRPASYGRESSGPGQAPPSPGPGRHSSDPLEGPGPHERNVRDAQRPQDDSGPQSPAPAAPSPRGAESGPDPGDLPADPSTGRPHDPDARRVIARATEIARMAREAGVDHHKVCIAVAGKASAKDLTPHDANRVITALQEIKEGRLELLDPDPSAGLGWTLAPPMSDEEKLEEKVDAYQARIHELREQQKTADRGGQQELPPNPEE
jgi:hypothetical protein